MEPAKQPKLETTEQQKLESSDQTKTGIQIHPILLQRYCKYEL
jgi:hypothetical protein